MCRKDGVQAAYRNDQRQEYVNNIAYKHRTGLGTAPWYGVPGTAYDFRHAHSAGHTYDTDASRPTGYGYQASVPQYHSQPSYGYGHAGYGNKKAGKCDGGYEEPHSQVGATAAAAAYPPRPHKAGPYNAVVVQAKPDGGYGVGLAENSKGYSEQSPQHGHSPPPPANHGKVGYDGIAKHADYVAGIKALRAYGYVF